MPKKQIHPSAKAKRKIRRPITTPPPLAGRMCEPFISPKIVVGRTCCPSEERGIGTPRKSPTARTKSKAVTIGQVRGEVKAVGIWVGHLRKVLGAVRPANMVLVEHVSWDGVAPPPPMVGRPCGPLPLDIRASDLVTLTGALRKEIDTIVGQLGRLPQDLEVGRPPRPGPIR